MYEMNDNLVSVRLRPYDEVSLDRTPIVRKPHPCPRCAKCFSSVHQLAQHTRVHSGEKPYKCSYCERRFKQQSHVKQHTRLHTAQVGLLLSKSQFLLSSTVRRRKALPLLRTFLWENLCTVVESPTAHEQPFKRP
jgi:hypothetical protein